MQTTCEFIDSVKAKHGLTSDYQLSKLIGCMPSAIYNYRAKKSHLDESAALKVAALLDIDAGYVMACIASERSKKPEVKAAWKHTAEMLGGLAAVLAVVALLPFAPGIEADSLSAPALLGFAAEPMYIMSNYIATLFFPNNHHPFPNFITPPAQSTLMVSFAAKRPSSISLASGFSSCD